MPLSGRKSIELRKKVNEMYFNHHLSKNLIAKRMMVSKTFVIRWTKSPDQDFAEDNRGWKKGRRRKWSKTTESRIRKIHRDLKNDPHQFYTGPTAIEQEWRKRYSDTPPPLRTIGRILSDLGLSGKRRKDRHRGAARYLCYPEHTVYTLLGGRVLEADFVGEKYITGRTEPLNFIAFSFKKEPKLRYFRRTDAQTTDEFIKHCKAFFRKFEKPDFIKVDNCLATIGSASGKRNISRTMRYLLKNRIIPIFAVPRKPFSQASVEGSASLFSRKFWNRIHFRNAREVDRKLEWFNRSSQRYTGYRPPKREKRKTDFIPKVYFIRQVKEDKTGTGKAFIGVLNEKVFLPKSYINYFVLAEWNLDEEKLYIRFEKEQRSRVVKKLSFKINPRSKIGA